MANKSEVIAEEILQILATRSELDSYQYACETGRDHQVVIGGVKSLESLGDVCDYKLVNYLYMIT